MPEEFKVGCQRPEIKKERLDESIDKDNVIEEEEKVHMLKVGKTGSRFYCVCILSGKICEC